MRLFGALFKMFNNKHEGVIMNKPSEATKILAMTECLLIWDRLAETGSQLKQLVINDLYQEKKIHTNDYISDCPFCDCLRNCAESCFSKNACKHCLWPGYRFEEMRCCDYDSEYYTWVNTKKISKRKIKAKKVLEMLLNIQMD